MYKVSDIHWTAVDGVTSTMSLCLYVNCIIYCWELQKWTPDIQIFKFLDAWLAELHLSTVLHVMDCRIHFRSHRRNGIPTLESKSTTVCAYSSNTVWLYSELRQSVDWKLHQPLSMLLVLCAVLSWWIALPPPNTAHEIMTSWIILTLLWFRDSAITCSSDRRIEINTCYHQHTSILSTPLDLSKFCLLALGSRDHLCGFLQTYWKQYV